MADHHERALVRRQRGLQLPDADQVEVVGGLAEQQQLRRRFGVQDAGRGGAQPFATREHPGRRAG